MSLTVTYRKMILDAMFGRSSFDIPATIYIGLIYSAPTYDEETGEYAFNEVADPAYERFEMTNDKDNWNDAASGTVSNKIAVTFPEASENWDDFGTIECFILSTTQIPDDSGVFAFGQLQEHLTVVTGNTVQFDPGMLECRTMSLPEYGDELWPST